MFLQYQEIPIGYDGDIPSACDTNLLTGKQIPHKGDLHMTDEPKVQQDQEKKEDDQVSSSELKRQRGAIIRKLVDIRRKLGNKQKSTSQGGGE